MNDDLNIIIGGEPIPNDWNPDSYKEKEIWEKRKLEIEDKNKKAEMEENTFCYRCHQTILNRIDGTIVSNTDTKREFELKFLYEGTNTIVNTQIVESNVNIHPENMQAALQLINDVDNIKCNTSLLLNSETGKIEQVLNLADIKQHWEIHKRNLLHKFKTIANTRSTDKEHLDNFIQLTEKSFTTQASFIKDLTTKLFFDIFFDKYLVGKTIENAVTGRTFYSLLFNQIPIKVVLSQTAVMDKDTGFFTISNYITSENQKRKDFDSDFIRKMYEQYYRPVVKYDFTYYNFNFDSKIVLGADNFPNEINVNLVEEVENNVEILVIYKIRRLK